MTTAHRTTATDPRTFTSERPPSGDDPLDAVDAVTHPDPWPWYRRLAEAPVQFDARIACWVVARPDDVAAVLTSADVTVAPAGTPVPPHLAGTPVGDLVGRMIRRRDGAGHGPLRAEVETWFGAVSPGRLDAALGRAAALLGRSAPSLEDAALIDIWADRFAAAAMAALLDVPEGILADVVTAAVALARACAPGATSATVPDALGAVASLERRWSDWSATPFVADVLGRVPSTDRLLVPANLVGCLVQSVDACAGAVTAVLRRRLGGDEDWAVLVEAVLRETPPVHQTRRWTPVDLRLPSGTVPAGGAMLVVLATGTDPGRGFGDGPHRCPAHGIVPAVVRAGASLVWNRLHDPEALVVRGCRPSANVRIVELDRAIS